MFLDISSEFPENIVVFEVETSGNEEEKVVYGEVLGGKTVFKMIKEMVIHGLRGGFRGF